MLQEIPFKSTVPIMKMKPLTRLKAVVLMGLLSQPKLNFCRLVLKNSMKEFTTRQGIIRDITDKKYYSKEITERFLFAMDRILGSRGSGKVTAKNFGDIVGISSSNLNRIRNNPSEYFVTIEAIGRICNHYRISAFWLLTGEGDLFSNDELASAYRILTSRVEQVENRVSEIEIIMPSLKSYRKK